MSPGSNLQYHTDGAGFGLVLTISFTTSLSSWRATGTDDMVEVLGVHPCPPENTVPCLQERGPEHAGIGNDRRHSIPTRTVLTTSADEELF